MFYSLIKGWQTYCGWLYFQDIKIVNKENIPQEGPLIIYGNHNNQFVDGMLLMALMNRNIAFIAAAASCRKTILGPIIKASGAIPVERPQDVARRGLGKILSLKQGIYQAQGRQNLRQRVQIYHFCATQRNYNHQKYLLDEEIVVTQKEKIVQGEYDYKVVPKLSFEEMYQSAWEGLRNNRCIGIFPEGGSHDQTGLLPLKAGICNIALGAMQKHNIPVKIVPCGFNYFKPQKFRSKVIIEFGPAYNIPIELLQLYKVNKKEAISKLLIQLEHMLKAVTTEISSFIQLSTLLICRDLYLLNLQRKLTTQQQIQLNRRFAKGYHYYLLQSEQNKHLHDRFIKFSQFMTVNDIPLQKQPYFDHYLIDGLRALKGSLSLIVMSCISLPGVVMMGPVMVLVARLAERERIRCLKASTVKVHGHDVVGSYKIMLGTILLPLSAALHSLLLFHLLKKFTLISPANIKKIALGMFLLQPIYGILFVKSFDFLKRQAKKLKALFVRLFRRNVYQQFNKEKEELNKIVLKMVQQYGEKVVNNFQDHRIVRKKSVQREQILCVLSDQSQNEENDFRILKK